MRLSVLLLAALALCATRASADLGAATGVLKRNLIGSSKKMKDGQSANAAGVSSMPKLPKPPHPEAGTAPSKVASTRELHYNADAIFPQSTPAPVSKYVGPIIGGVVGAGALAGVIAISVMHKPSEPPATGTADDGVVAAAPQISARESVPAPAPAAPFSTSLSAAVAEGSSLLQAASTAGIGAGDTLEIGSEYNLVKSVQGTSITLDHPMNTPQDEGATITVAHSAASPTQAPAPAQPQPTAPPQAGSLPLAREAGTTVAPGSSIAQNTILAIIGALVCCGLLSGFLIALLWFMGRKKKRSKTEPRRDSREFVPSGSAYSQSGSAYSQYAPEEHALLNGPGSMPTMVNMQQTQDLSESQYMPVPPSPYVAPASYDYANIGSVPTMMQSMPPPPPVPVTTGPMYYPDYGQPQASYSGTNPGYGGSMYQANTVNALPTTAFNMQQMPPTMY